MSDFLATNPEAADMNQYWYSQRTISTIVEDLVQQAPRIAFLSTPSLYFSLPGAHRCQCSVFDYDRKWESDRGFVFYDFHAPDALPAQLHHSFDMTVIDAPFITRDVLDLYAKASRLLLASPGALIYVRVESLFC